MRKPIEPRQLLLAALLALAPFGLFAHTGVGSTSGFLAGFGHPFSGADHLLAMLAIGLWAAQSGGRALWAVPSAFVLVMVGAALLGLGGVALPFVEVGILLSVLLLGLLITAAAKPPLLASLLLVSLFAVFHGHAHGTEMLPHLQVVGYTGGFALATALLHLLGMAFGVALQRLSLPRLAPYAGLSITLSGVYLLLGA
jgi:urease accessory protein